jgi:hypothetical protein
MGAGLHQVGDGAAVARALDDEVGDERDRLGIVELDAALEPAARHHGGHGDEQLVLFAEQLAAPAHAPAVADQAVAERLAHGDAAEDHRLAQGQRGGGIDVDVEAPVEACA